MNDICREPGCERTDLYGRGLCGKHYQFYRYHGRLDEIAPRPEGRACAQCGGPIKASLRQWAAEFCSSSCAHKARYEEQRPERRHSVCEQCGISLAGKRPQSRFCSAKCGSDHRNAALAAARRANRKPCVNCSQPIPLKHRRFCSDACKREARRPETYGLTGIELTALLAQHEVCAVCGTADWGRKGPQVDHDHSTGRIRGILCANCNRGLGYFLDERDRLEAAIAYLNR